MREGWSLMNDHLAAQVAWQASRIPLILLRADHTVYAVNPAARARLGIGSELPGWLSAAIQERFDKIAARGRPLSSGDYDWVAPAPGEPIQRVSVASISEDGDSEAVWLVSVERGGPGPVERIDLAEEAWGLTPREVEAVALLADGLGDREIAAEMAVSEATVKYHLQSIREKSGTSSRTDLLAKLFAL